MEITADEVKAWLSKYDRDRYWLAKICKAEKGTVDNWLSTSRGIPSKALRIIEKMMATDKEASDATSQPPPDSHLVLKIVMEEFERWSKAGLAKNMTVTEYCLAAVRSAYEADTADKVTALPSSYPTFSGSTDRSGLMKMKSDEPNTPHR